jgi:ABC-type transporter Mla MlaB component
MLQFVPDSLSENRTRVASDKLLIGTTGVMRVDAVTVSVISEIDSEGVAVLLVERSVNVSA